VGTARILAELSYARGFSPVGPARRFSVGAQAPACPSDLPGGPFAARRARSLKM